MKKAAKIFTALLAALVLALAVLLAGCSRDPYVVSIAQTSRSGTETVYTITYSDGSTSTFSVSDGEDGEDVSIQDVYEQYLASTGQTSDDVSYADFLKTYLTLNTDNSAVVGETLLSTVSVYTEFIAQSSSSGSYFPWLGGGSTIDTAVYTGAGVIWSMDTSEDGYTYFVTNYHVVYNANATAANAVGNENGDRYIARKIVVYLYGSEDTITRADANGDGVADRDDRGYAEYDYGDLAIECDYVGGSISSDVAVLRAETAKVLAVNADAKEIELADDYYVGQSVFTVGNPDSDGLSVTEGVISVDNEYITLDIDGTDRQYRSIRTDVALYSGNSGGGLFNNAGQLVGLSNAGASSEQNINYAVPLPIVRGTVENILHYNDGTARRLTLGVTVSTQNSKYVYDSSTGTGSIVEETVVQSVASSSIAADMDLQTGDILTHLVVNGTEYALERSFDVSDILLTVFANDTISFRYTRDGQSGQSGEYTVDSSAPQTI